MRLVHQPTGWLVDPILGKVFGGRWATREIGWIAGNGYPTSAGADRRTRTLHRVIWETVHGPIPSGLEINHLNGIKTDNRIANLELVTPSGNRRHAYETGLLPPPPVMHGVDHPAAKITPAIADQIREAVRCGATQRAAGRQFGISQRTVWAVVTGRRWPSPSI